jgi:hypothetical protein
MYFYSSCDVRVHCILQGPFYIVRRYIRDGENAARVVLLVIRIKHLALTTRIVTIGDPDNSTNCSCIT